MSYSEAKAWSMETCVKSDKKATGMRNEGNNLYKNGKYFEAMLKYNQALCYAESQQQQAFAYGNRSAVYLEMKLYNQCLHNIQLARDNNYPAEKMSTLDDREERCKEQMIQKKPKQQPDLSDNFKLSYPANPKIPFIIDGLEVKTSEKYGRGVYTKRELKVGDIICLEKPIFGAINTCSHLDGQDSNKYNYCYQCLNDNILDLIPCSSCTSTMFCNEDCMTKAQQVHQYDCDMIEFYYLIKLQLFVRTFLSSVAIMNGSVDDLEKLFNEFHESSKTVFDFDFSDPNDPEYKKNQLGTMLSLCNKKCDSNDIRDTKKIKKIIREHLQAKGIWTPRCDNFIMKFLSHLKSQHPSQVLIYRWPLNGAVIDALLARPIGIGSHMFGSLINHSCDPNTIPFQTYDIRGMMVSKPIKKGEQLFKHYKDCNFFSMPYEQRKELLKSIEIDCDCDACRFPYRYEMLQNLKVKNSGTMKFALEMSDKIKRMQHKDLIEAAKTLAMKCQKTYSPKDHPTREWVTMMFILTRCLGMMQESQNVFTN